MKNAFVLLISLFLSGCFDTPSSGGFSPSASSPNSPISQEPNVFGPLITQASLPTCDNTSLGSIYYNESDSSFKACKLSGWIDINVRGAQGIPGIPGVSGSTGPAGDVGPTGPPGPGAKSYSGIYSYTGTTTGTSVYIPISSGDTCLVEILGIAINSFHYLYNKSNYVISRSANGTSGSSLPLGTKETNTSFNAYDATPKASFSDLNSCPTFPDKACVSVPALGANVATKWKVVAKVTCLNDSSF